MVTDDEIMRAISLARQNKLKIILKPMVEVRDAPGKRLIDSKQRKAKR
jgi:hypothetical protein